MDPQSSYQLDFTYSALNTIADLDNWNELPQDLLQITERTTASQQVVEMANPAVGSEP